MWVYSLLVTLLKCLGPFGVSFLEKLFYFNFILNYELNEILLHVLKVSNLIGATDERGEMRKNKEKKNYQNEETQPPCNLSSSIYYGGQENYPSSTPPQSTNNPDAVSVSLTTNIIVLSIGKVKTSTRIRFPSYASKAI